MASESGEGVSVEATLGEGKVGCEELVTLITAVRAQLESRLSVYTTLAAQIKEKKDAAEKQANVQKTLAAFGVR